MKIQWNSSSYSKGGKILPVTDLEIAAEKKLREEALVELAVSISMATGRITAETLLKIHHSNYNVRDSKHV